MNSEITAYLAWSICFFITIINGNKSTGNLASKQFKIHYFLAWIILMLNASAFNMLGYVFSTPEAIKELFFVEIAKIPAWLNLISWIINLALGVFSIILVFMLIKQSKNAKKWLLKIMPFSYVFGVLEALKSFYSSPEFNNEPMFSVILYFSTIYLIPYTAIFYFYTNKKFTEYIFGKEDKLENRI